MTTTTESLLMGLSDRVDNLYDAYVKLEVTTRTETKALREDLAEMRDLLRDVIRTQANLGERLTAGETKISALRDERVRIADMNTRLSVLEKTVEHNAPVRTPWTAIVSAFVALGALAWTLFGK